MDKEIDLSTADRGNEIVDPAAEAAAAAAAEAAKAAAEAQAAADLAALEKKPEGNTEGEANSGEEDQPRNDKGQFEARIPKSRFDEAVGKEREAREAAEARAADLEAKLRAKEEAQARATDTEAAEARIGDLEKQHTKLLLDGDEEGAAKVMREIRQAERAMAVSEAEARATARMGETLERERLDATIARLQAEYPQLNDKSEEYDDDVTEFVLSKQATLMRTQGLTPSVALAKAATEVMARFAKQPEKQPEKEGLAAAAAETNKADARRTAQVQKNIEAAAKQPASLKDAGLDSDKTGQGTELPDPSKLTAEEYDKLPEATKRRMRGDDF